MVIGQENLVREGDARRVPTLGGYALIGCLLVAVGLRLVLLAQRVGNSATGEAFNVARAVAEGRGFADAYRIGQGPTAHLQPVSPAVAGAVYRVLGVQSAAAEWLLGTWSIGLVVGSFYLLAKVFARLGTPFLARLSAVLFLAAFPMYAWLEVVTFRIWDGALTVFLVSLFLERFTAMSLENIQAYSKKAVTKLAIIAAATFFTNPVMGLGCYAVAALFCLNRFSIGKAITTTVIALSVLVAVLLPWTIRNALVMHDATPLRDNGGLELAISMYPEAVNTNNEMEAFLRRICAVHPAEYKQCAVFNRGGPGPYRQMQLTGGERAYASALGGKAKAWMIAHPADAARLMLRHLRETYMPPSWAFVVLTEAAHVVILRTIVADLIGAAGVAGALLAIWRRRPGWNYIAVFVFVPGAAMSLFQPVTRYDYLFYSLLVFCAFDLIGFLYIQLRRAEPPIG